MLKGIEGLRIYSKAFLNGEMEPLEWRNYTILALADIESEQELTELAIAIDRISAKE